MSTPYVGEIRMFGFSRVPTGWFACDGSLKSIANYQVLFTLIGTTYGGDGVQTFAVPNLQGSVPIHEGNGQGLTPRVLGEVGGVPSVTLLAGQMPQHTHSLMVSTAAANTANPGSGVVLAAPATPNALYYPASTGTTPHPLVPTAMGMTGGTLPHDNNMPTLTVAICIAWAGVFPSRN